MVLSLFFSKDVRRVVGRAIATPAVKIGQVFRGGRTRGSTVEPSKATARVGVISHPIDVTPVVTLTAPEAPVVTLTAPEAPKPTPVAVLSHLEALPASLLQANRSRQIVAQMSNDKVLDNLLDRLDALEERFCSEEAADVLCEAFYAIAAVRAMMACPYGLAALMEHHNILLLLPAVSAAANAMSDLARRRAERAANNVVQVPSIKVSTIQPVSLSRVDSDASTTSGMTSDDATPQSALGSVLPGPFSNGRPALQDKPMSRLSRQGSGLNPFAKEFKPSGF